jgi:DNA polymerase V
MQQLVGEDTLQHHLLVPLPEEQQQRRQSLMATIDRINRRYGQGSVQWAACGFTPPWQMQRSRLSRAATTRLGEIPIVYA